MAGATPKSVTPSGYGPSQLRAAYNFGATGSSSTLIAIVDAYGYTNAAADLAVYRAKFGLPACTIANGCLAIYNELGQKGNYPAQNLGWAQEQSLDLDMASAACPNCRIALIQANSNSYSDLAAAENLAARLGARAISNSLWRGRDGTQFSNPPTTMPASRSPRAPATMATAPGRNSLRFTVCDRGRRHEL